jgi:protein farnesyltransferase/geranylgeranyltransferase type-1 subunit alpha
LHYHYSLFQPLLILYNPAMGKYSSSPIWADIIPTPLDEGPGPGPALATIAYPEKYSEAMSYLRSVMAQNEYSDRCLALTEDIISMNPAHYTVWLYRGKILQELNKDVYAELRWLEGISFKHLKNYQIWHHRQVLMSTLSSVPPNEIPFLTSILALDTKNYHVWSYRQWLCMHFASSMLSSPAELAATEALIVEDVRNNSAWNHRYFLCFGADELRRGKEEARKVVDEELIDREVEYTKAKIRLAPQNQSPWNYLKGVLKRGGRSLVEEQEFAAGFVGDVNGEEVRSSHAVDWVAECFAEQGESEKAKECLEALGRKWDPVRKNYWDYRAKQLDSAVAAGGMRAG